MYIKAQTNIVENFAQSYRIYYAPVTYQRQEPSMGFMFLYNERIISTGFCNRASLFDRIRSRVVTRECLKLVASAAHNRDIRVTPSVCSSVCFLLSRFFSFFTSAHPLRIASPRDQNTRQETPRRCRSHSAEKSYTRAYEFFKRHDSL